MLSPEKFENIFSEFEVERKDFHRCLDDVIKKELEQQTASKKKIGIENRVAQEVKINKELQENHNKICDEGARLKKACANLKAHLTVNDNDMNRLDQAKAMCEFGKEATGIRFDYSAPPKMVKGYIKNESRKKLVTFKEAETACPEALWSKLYDMVDPRWADCNENKPPNNF